MEPTKLDEVGLEFKVSDLEESLKWLRRSIDARDQRDSAQRGLNRAYSHGLVDGYLGAACIAALVYLAVRYA